MKESKTTLKTPTVQVTTPETPVISLNQATLWDKTPPPRMNSVSIIVLFLRSPALRYHIFIIYAVASPVQC